MQLFLAHIGVRGSIDVYKTITRTRSFDEILANPSVSLKEKSYLNDRRLREAFPDGNFNCWGLPNEIDVEPIFRMTNVGDVVLFLPKSGSTGAVEYMGIVKGKISRRCDEIPRYLWPETSKTINEWPWLLFFNTELVLRRWRDLLRDIGYRSNYQPRGTYRRIDASHLKKWRGVSGYTDFLRSKCGWGDLSKLL